MGDVFETLIGQDEAVVAMRHHAKHPVHAYLFSGPVGSELHDTVVAFAAALQCPDHGCGQCERCRLVMAELDPDVYVASRAGVSWRIDELREVERVSRRRPLGTGYQIVIIDDVELTVTGPSPIAPALLKTLEEPALKTIFLLSAEEVPSGLDTIVSRCVEVRLRGLAAGDLATVLMREGADEGAARRAADAANGNLRRARVLVRDVALAERMAQWRAVPDHLDGTPASASVQAAQIAHALDEALAPLVRLQGEEMERQRRDAREAGQRAPVAKRDLEAQFKREQRRFRSEELRFGFTALTNVYRERMSANLATPDGSDARSRYRVGAAIRAIDVIAEASRRLSSNIDETLLLNDLMLSLMEF